MKNTRPYRKPAKTQDLRDAAGRIVLAHGEVTGHHHAVCAADSATDIADAEFFEEPDGRRVLLALAPCVLTHPEHGLIVLEPAAPTQVRQGDVLLTPIGPGAWVVTRQVEYVRGELRTVAD